MQENHEEKKERLFQAAGSPTASMLVLESRTKECYAIARHSIQNARFSSKDTITFEFENKTATLSGKKLTSVYQLLVAHRLILAREGSPEREKEEHFETWIDEITITVPDGEGGLVRIFPS